MIERPRAGERAVLVRLGLGMPVKREDLEEFEQLARSAGAYPVATITGRRARPDGRDRSCIQDGAGRPSAAGAVSLELSARGLTSRNRVREAATLPEQLLELPT